MARIPYVVGVLVLLLSAAHADPFLHVTGTVNPPMGFVEFCKSNLGICTPQTEKINFTVLPKNLSQLDQVNRLVNEAIEPVTDLELYGVDEYWTLPKKRGDCEDFALLKQQMLLSLGWPQDSLLLTVVKDEHGEGHAVLTARTGQGDYILDNKVQQVLLWNQMPYHFVMRQSLRDPAKWYSLEK